MGRGRCAFTKAAVKRALSAAKEAGVDVRIEIDADRKVMKIITVKPGEADDYNEWDEDDDDGEDRIGPR